MAKDSKVISPYASDRSSSCLVCAASARERARTARLGEPGGGAPGPHLVALALRDRLAQPRVAELPEYFVEELLALVQSEGEESDALAFKIDGRVVSYGPSPKPYREIWVYHPDMEGVHLRGGSVARGGLRFSDRPDDFRTEIHGLMATQMVKNVLIVPMGAKGWP